MTDLVADAAVWRDRARVADEAAAELDLLAGDTAGVIRWNYLGRDCLEGQALFDQLASFLDCWRAEIFSLSSALYQTADACRRSADAYTVVDLSARSGFGGGE